MYMHFSTSSQRMVAVPTHLNLILRIFLNKIQMRFDCDRIGRIVFKYHPIPRAISRLPIHTKQYDMLYLPQIDNLFNIHDYRYIYT